MTTTLILVAVPDVAVAAPAARVAGAASVARSAVATSRAVGPTLPPRVGNFQTGPVMPGQVAAPQTPGGHSSVGTVRARSFNDAGVLAYGDAGFLGSPTNLSLSAPIVGMASTPDGKGYWLAAADGGVFSYGDAAFYGSAGDIPLYAPIVGMASTPDGKGYWLVAVDGGIFSFGDAGFYGSTGAEVLNEPVVGMSATPDGKGYWLVAADGGIFTFGDAGFYGSTGAEVLNSPIVAMASTPDGKGYWLAAGDGGVFTFGDAIFAGSMGDQGVAFSISGMAVTPDGGGYWLVGSGGAIYYFGDAGFYGSNVDQVPTPPITGMAAAPDGKGYWLLARDAFPTVFDHPSPPEGFAGARSVVAAAAGQVGGNPDSGYFCNPYGPCEEWCALFATWAWSVDGIAIPRYAFTGDIYTWAAQNGHVLAPDAMASPGDIVLYGIGPQTVDTSVHTGVVADVWPDGAVVTIEGDAGPGPPGSHNVLINGPYLPGHSLEYNGVGIYAIATP